MTAFSTRNAESSRASSRRMFFVSVCSVLCLFFVLSLPIDEAVARVCSRSDLRKSVKLKDAARKKRNGYDYDAAIVLLKRAWAACPRAAYKANIGYMYGHYKSKYCEALGHLKVALSETRDELKLSTKRRGSKASQRETVLGYQRQFRRRAKGLLQIVVSPSSATVTISGRSFSARQTRKGLLVRPGTYTYVVSAKGFKSHTDTVTVPVCRLANAPVSLDRLPAPRPKVIYRTPRPVYRPTSRVYETPRHTYRPPPPPSHYVYRHRRRPRRRVKKVDLTPYFAGSKEVKRLRSGFRVSVGMAYIDSYYAGAHLTVAAALHYTYTPVSFSIETTIPGAGSMRKAPEEFFELSSVFFLKAQVSYMVLPVLSWLQLYLNFGYLYGSIHLGNGEDSLYSNYSLDRKDHMLTIGPSVWIGAHAKGRYNFSYGLLIKYDYGGSVDGREDFTAGGSVTRNTKDSWHMLTLLLTIFH